MRLRIVIPVLNEGGSGGMFTSRLKALRSLRAHGAEVVVVDGGSTDDTWAIARRLADRMLAAPRGRAAQMNAGARAPGERLDDVLLFLHADTCLPMNADKLIFAAIQQGAAWGRFDVHHRGASES